MKQLEFPSCSSTRGGVGVAQQVHGRRRRCLFLCRYDPALAAWQKKHSDAVLRTRFHELGVEHAFFCGRFGALVA